MKLKLKKKVLRGIGGRDVWSALGGGSVTPTYGACSNFRCPTSVYTTCNFCTQGCPQATCNEDTCDGVLATCDSTGRCTTEGCSAAPP
jgi:hypothetical protein